MDSYRDSCARTSLGCDTDSYLLAEGKRYVGCSRHCSAGRWDPFRNCVGGCRSALLAEAMTRMHAHRRHSVLLSEETNIKNEGDDSRRGPCPTGEAGPRGCIATVARR